jgi:dTDP-4-amino-4,6-dideoxygalactose transaminase
MNSKNMLSSLFIHDTSLVRDALKKMDEAAHGVLLLIAPDGRFERTVTDGDLRRLLLTEGALDATLINLPSIKPLTLGLGEYTRRQALNLMNENSIHHIPVIDGAGVVVELLDRKTLDEQILLSTPHLGDFEREYVEEAFRTNWIAPLGPNVDAFEREIATEVGVKHAAAVSSGTAAIHLALRLLNVGPGDVVFCSALTFVATANPIVYQGAEPVFIDSEPESWNMSPEALERAFEDARKNGKLPKAALVVNLYGQSADMDPLLDLCNRYGVPMIEDAAESLGGRYKGRASGSIGKLGIFSFNGNKIITTSGGGMLVSDDEDLIKQARFLATQAREPVPHYEHTTIGYNYRMSNILAGVGRGQLRVLSDRVNARRAVFDRYRASLKDVAAIEWMAEPDWSYSNRWLTTGVIRPEMTSVTSSMLMKLLAEEMVEARPVWKPMQIQPIFAGTRYFEHKLGHSVSADLFERGFCLPSGSNMSVQQQDRVIEAVSSIFSSR